MKKRYRLTIAYVITGLIVLFIVQSQLKRSDQVELPYSEFRARLQQKRIKDVIIFDDEIRGTFVRAERDKQRFVTRRVPSDLVQELDQQGVRYSRGEYLECGGDSSL